MVLLLSVNGEEVIDFNLEESIQIGQADDGACTAGYLRRRDVSETLNNINSPSGIDQSVDRSEAPGKIRQ